MPTGTVLSKAQMEEIVSVEPGFAEVKYILKELFDAEPTVHFILNAKFWCNLQWVEQYWNDTKRDTREKCDYTLPTLKKQFPISLATVCPVKNLRNYMARSFRHMDVLREIGRNGDFSKFPSIDAKYVRHRDSMRIGEDIDALDSGEKRKSRGGVRASFQSSKRKTAFYPRARTTAAAAAQC